MVLLCLLLGIACVIDYHAKKIPNCLILLIGCSGVLQSFLSAGFAGTGSYLCKSVMVFLFLLPFYCIGGVGAGDVKLMAVCSGYFFQSEIIWFLFLSMLISAIFSLYHFIKEKDVLDRIRYFGQYCAAVAKSGKWYLYLPRKGDRLLSGVCMSGPILCSVLLRIGGVY